MGGRGCASAVILLYVKNRTYVSWPSRLGLSSALTPSVPGDLHLIIDCLLERIRWEGIAHLDHFYRTFWKCSDLQYGGPDVFLGQSVRPPELLWGMEDPEKTERMGLYLFCDGLIRGGIYTLFCNDISSVLLSGAHVRGSVLKAVAGQGSSRDMDREHHRLYPLDSGLFKDCFKDCRLVLGQKHACF